MYAYLLLISAPILAHSICPGLYRGTPPTGHALIPDPDLYDQAVNNLDIAAVIADIDALLTDSQPCWPSDTFDSGSSYGPLFVRLAWHSSGTYRNTDYAGGAGGGRQRFDPEASWEDNTNLDKARALLATIKDKYGIGLSWGDLIVFAGSSAIINMGGPVGPKICAGRIDSANGALSLPLGPGPLTPPCDLQGDCTGTVGGTALGTSTEGLIYVNPEGFMGSTEPADSAAHIREVFGRMGMNDRETVALIGGGHAFGKSHGACPDGAGAHPDEDRFNPWPGKCGTGKEKDTFTSGIEGQWTSDPLKWDNEYFKLLMEYEYTLITGPGGAHQWKHPDNDLMMMTTDLALTTDPYYLEIVKEFAEDIHALDEAFGLAWQKLMTNGGEWAGTTKCIDIEWPIYTTTAQPI